MKNSQGRTQLYANQFTEKDNPVIIFRGKLDKVCAVILEAQYLAAAGGNKVFVDELQEILEFIRKIFQAEYTENPLGEIMLLGMSFDDIRQRSHFPEKFFGQKHLVMNYTMGELSIKLNLLRTLTREAELAAVTAFRDTETPSKCRRDDIVQAMNRLSSLFYVLMYKYLK